MSADDNSVSADTQDSFANVGLRLRPAMSAHWAASAKGRARGAISLSPENFGRERWPSQPLTGFASDGLELRSKVTCRALFNRGASTR